MDDISNPLPTRTGPTRLKPALTQAAGFLGAEARRAHAEGQAGLQRHLCQLVAEFGACSNCLGGPPGAPPSWEGTYQDKKDSSAAMAAFAWDEASVSAEVGSWD